MKSRADRLEEFQERLLKAAPLMLEACEMALALLEGHGTGMLAKSPAGQALVKAIQAPTGKKHVPIKDQNAADHAILARWAELSEEERAAFLEDYSRRTAR